MNATRYGLVASLAGLDADVPPPGASSLDDGSAPEHADKVLATMLAVMSEVQIAALIARCLSRL